MPIQVDYKSCPCRVMTLLGERQISELLEKVVPLKHLKPYADHRSYGYRNSEHNNKSAC